MIDAGATERVADLMVGLEFLFHESALAETTLTVEQITGHPPRSLSDWLIENIALFR